MRHADKRNDSADSAKDATSVDLPEINYDEDDSDFDAVDLDDISFARMVNDFERDSSEADFAPAVPLDEDELSRLQAEDNRNRGGRGLKIALAVACVAAVAGAGIAFALSNNSKSQEAFEPQQTTLAAETKDETPQLEKAHVKADNVRVASSIVLQRGDQLTNVREASDLTGGFKDQYYLAEFNGKTFYVEKSAVRLSSEADPEEWTGYATEGAVIYKRADLTGDDKLELEQNTELAVLDSFNNLVYVRNADGYEGYMAAEMVSREAQLASDDAIEVVTDATAAEAATGTDATANATTDAYSYNSNNYNYSYNTNTYSGGNTSSGGSTTNIDTNSGGTDNTSGNNTGGNDNTGGTTETPSNGGSNDTGTGGNSGANDYSWIFGASAAYADEVSADSGITAKVLINDVQTYVALLNEADVFEVNPDLGSASYAVEINGQSVSLAKDLVRLESDDPYEAWAGYAVDRALTFSDYALTQQVGELAANDSVDVVDSIGNVLVVRVGNVLLCMAVDNVSKEVVQVEATSETAPVE